MTISYSVMLLCGLEVCFWATATVGTELAASKQAFMEREAALQGAAVHSTFQEFQAIPVFGHRTHIHDTQPAWHSPFRPRGCSSTSIRDPLAQFSPLRQKTAACCTRGHQQEQCGSSLDCSQGEGTEADGDCCGQVPSIGQHSQHSVRLVVGLGLVTVTVMLQRGHGFQWMVEKLSLISLMTAALALGGPVCAASEPVFHPPANPANASTCCNGCNGHAAQDCALWMESNQSAWPCPVGLCLGLLAVAVGQLLVIGYFLIRHQSGFCKPIPIQKEALAYDLWKAVKSHLAQPEGFVMLGSYLIGTWMFRIMPASYYSFEGGVSVVHVIQQASSSSPIMPISSNQLVDLRVRGGLCHTSQAHMVADGRVRVADRTQMIGCMVCVQLLIQDILQTMMHRMEHKLHPLIYKLSHKPHHRFTNPKMFDAFDGSPSDTFFMILVPLFATAQLVHCNVWSYMAFGTVYSMSLVLIHSEFHNPWDPLWRALGIGTAGDHHVHHKTFIFNYGHIFMYWDRIMGTYKSPADVGSFNQLQ